MSGKGKPGKRVSNRRRTYSQMKTMWDHLILRGETDAREYDELPGTVFFLEEVQKLFESLFLKR